MNKAEEDWFTDACGALAVIEEEDNEAAEAEYAKAYSLLAKRLVTAEKLDADGKLKKQMDVAQALVEQGKFTDAVDALDAAGSIATKLISSAPGKKKLTKEGEAKVLEGKSKGATYENEQYEEDSDGNVKHGGTFRGASKVRTRYADEEDKDKTAMRVDDKGRLVDREGKPIDGKTGYAVNAETGTAHTLDATLTAQKGPKDYTLFEHHTTPLAGEKAAAAGMQELDRGVVRKINSESGHYRPEPEHTHQYVEGLKEQGVQMREKKLTMFNEKNEPVPVDGTTEREYDMVEQYEKHRASTGDQGEYNPQYQAMKDRLKAKGVGPSERDATVEVFDKRSKIGDAEWKDVAGDLGKIQALMEKKLGSTLEKLGGLFKIVNPNDQTHCNDVLGKYLRFGGGGEDAGRVKMKAEQFVQTGGNMDAVEAKKKVGEEILQKRITQLGGVAKLIELGVADHSKLPLKRQLDILEGTEPVPKAEVGKPRKMRGALQDPGEVEAKEDQSQEGVVERKPRKVRGALQDPSEVEAKENEAQEGVVEAKKVPLKIKPLSEEEKAEGYIQGKEAEEEEVEGEEQPKKTKLKAKPLSEEEKAEGYVEDKSAEEQEVESEEKPEEPKLKAKKLTEEEKAEGYVEDKSAEEQEVESEEKTEEPKLKAKKLTEEEKAEGYVEDKSAEEQEVETEEKPEEPKLKAKKLTEEEKAEGYVEDKSAEEQEVESEEKLEEPKLKAKKLTEEEKAEGYVEDKSAEEQEVESEEKLEEPKLKAKKLTEEEKAEGYVEDKSAEEQEVEAAKKPEEPKLKAKKLTEEEKAEGYVEDKSAEEQEVETEEKPKESKLKARKLTEEEKAEGYVEDKSAEEQEVEAEEKPEEPKLKAKKLTEEEKAEGYVEDKSAEEQEVEAEEKPEEPKLKAKKLTEEEKAEGYVEDKEIEGQEVEAEEKPEKPKLKAKKLTEEEKAEGYVEDKEIEGQEHESEGDQPKEPKLKAKPKVIPPQPKGPPPIDIRQVKKPTGPDPLQKNYDEKGGDEALLAIEIAAWKKRNAPAMGAFRELEKRRKLAMTTFEKSKAGDNPEQAEEDKAALDAIALELANFKKDLDTKDAMPTRARLAKLPVAERLKRLGV